MTIYLRVAVSLDTFYWLSMSLQLDLSFPPFPVTSSMAQDETRR